MKKIQYFAAVAVALFAANGMAQDVVIRNVELVSVGSSYSNPTNVVIRDGKVSAIGNQAMSEGASVIDGTGKRLSVGLFNASTELGVREVGAVAGTVDSSSTNSRVTASLRVADAVNPSSVLLPHNRMLGLTHALVMPKSDASLFAGTAAVIRLAKEKTVVKQAAALVVELDSSTREIAGGSRAASMLQLREAFQDARDYLRNTSSFNAGNRRDYALSRHDLAAIGHVLEKKMPLLVHVNRASDITWVLEFARQQQIDLILAGVAEGWRVAQQIARDNVAVIVDPIDNLPTSYDTLGTRLDNAKLLHDAGVTLVFTGMSWHNTHNAYLVRQSAGNAVANGVPYEVALAAVTVNPTKLFDLSGSGKVEVGAPANLVLWGGDPFETQTAAEKVWLNGVEYPLISRATRLRDRYFQRISEQIKEKKH